jgi:hypothetical protein
VRVVAVDPAAHSRLVVEVDALGGHRVDEGPGHAPVRRVHHLLAEPRRYLVQLSFQRACRALRHLAAFGEVGEEVADRGDRVLGVVGVERGDLARVDLQQQLSQVPGSEIGRALDVEVVPHQVEQRLYLADGRFRIGAQLPLRGCRPLPEAIQRRIEGVLRHRAQP